MEENLPAYLFEDGTLSGSESEMAANLVELFKEVDVNGDGDLDWEEFTRFMVEKAALFKESQALDRVLQYSHNTTLETTGAHRHHESIDALAVLPRYRQFACVENHSPLIALYSARSGELVSTMKCNAVPLNVCYIEPLQALVASCADSTIVRFNVGESHHKVSEGRMCLFLCGLYASTPSYSIFLSLSRSLAPLLRSGTSSAACGQLLTPK